MWTVGEMTYEDGIGDLVTDLVGVSLTDGLAFERNRVRSGPRKRIEQESEMIKIE